MRRHARRFARLMRPESQLLCPVLLAAAAAAASDGAVLREERDYRAATSVLRTK